MSYLFTSSSGTKIDYGHVAGFDGAAKLSISWWFKLSAGDSYGGYFCQLGANTSGTGEQAGFWCGTLGTDLKDLMFVVRNEAGGTTPFFNTNSDHFSTSAWNHCLLVYDGTQATNDAKIRIYFNGTEVTSNLNRSGTFPSTLGTCNQPLKIGEGQATGNLNISGRVAEVGFFIGTALNSTNATALAAGNLCSTIAGCTHQMRLLNDPNDNVGGLTGTVTGATSDADHPTMLSSGNSRLIQEHLKQGSF